MQEKNFNLEEHRKVLIVEALNDSRTISEAATKLGLAERTVYRDIGRFNIKKNERNTYTIKK